MIIYHTSDLHDHRGIAPRLRELRSNEPGLLFDCGDSLRGSQTVFHRNEPIVADIDAAGYDAQAMGNREFHYLYACVRARSQRMRHPLVCSNLLPRAGRTLPFTRSLDFQRDGTRLRVLGLLVLQYPPGSPWERFFGWRFLDPIETVLEFSRELPPEQPLVVLSHLGLRYDRRLAAAVPRITLLLGGHSHDTLREPEMVAGVPIVHAGPYGAHVSRTELTLADGHWRVRRSELLPLLA